MMMRINHAMAWLIVTSLVAASGCTQPGPTPEKARGTKSEKGDKGLDLAADILREAESTTNYREALDRVNSHVSKVKPAFGFADVDRDSLSKRYELQKDDLDFLIDRSFRPLDTNYLEGCIILRDAARAIEQKNAPPLVQARLAFDWVMRQVLLREQQAALWASSFVLERGHGNSWERSVLFLDLLHQFGIDGCLVIASEGEKNLLYAGAVIPANDGADIYLFDARLGQPLRSGGTIETLAALRKRLKAADVKVFAAASLPALSPRMKFLHDQMAVRDQVALAIEPAGLLKRLDAAAGAEVLVWTRNQQPGGSPKGTPLIALQNLLPSAAQGNNQLKQYLQVQRLPWPNISRVFSRLRLVEPHLTPEALTRLEQAMQAVYFRFVYAPQEFLLRGQYDRIHRRLDGIQSALNDLEHGPLDDPGFHDRVNKWRTRIYEASVAVTRAAGNPQLEDALRGKLESIWNEDQYFFALMTRDGVPMQQEAGNVRGGNVLPKGALTFIVLAAMHQDLEPECARLFAQMWHEKAEHAQANLEMLHAQNAADPALPRAHEKARAAWTNARGQWNRYLDRFYFFPNVVQARLASIADRLDKRDAKTALLLSQFLLDFVTEGADAKLNLARTHRQLGDNDAARHHLQALVDDLTVLQQNIVLTETMNKARETAPELRALAAEFGDNGAIHWLRENARLQLLSPGE